MTPATAVWKFQVKLKEEFTLRMPAGAGVLYVGVQNGKPCLWARVNPDAFDAERTFYLRETGQAVEPDLRYVGSFMLDDDGFVGHLFERDPSIDDLLTDLLQKAQRDVEPLP